MNKYEQYILSCVESKGFEIGKELNRKLQEKFSVNSSNARKILQRAVVNGFVHTTDPVSFGNGQFAYLPREKYLNKEMILKITKEHRPPLYRVLSAMDVNGGIISYYEALKVSGSPLDGRLTKTDTLDKLITELESLRMIEVARDNKGINYLIHPNMMEEADKYTAEHYAKMKTDVMFIPDILRTLKDHNIIDNVQILYRNKAIPSIGVSHNNFVWDAIAYTKTTGINPGKAVESNIPEKQTMVVMDIVVHRPYTDHDFQGFYSRIQSILNSVKTGRRKVLPIVIYAEVHTKKLYNTIHKLGFLTFNLGAIYGSKIYDIIRNLNQLKVDDLQLDSKVDFSKMVEDTLSAIKNAGQEGNLKNIKGDLFEFLMYPILPKIFSNYSVQHGKKLSNPANKKEGYEYDFIVSSPDYNETTVIELKGFSDKAKIALGDSNTKNTVSWFFGKTFPFAKQMLAKQMGNPKITACYITSGGFQDDAKKHLEVLNKGKLKPKEIDLWYDREKLLRLLHEKGLRRVKTVIEKYYVKEEGDEEQ